MPPARGADRHPELQVVDEGVEDKRLLEAPAPHKTRSAKAEWEEEADAA